MSNEQQILPSYRSDNTYRLVTNWDYDEFGMWGKKQYIKCIVFILSLYSLLFYSLYYLYYMKIGGKKG